MPVFDPSCPILPFLFERLTRRADRCIQKHELVPLAGDQPAGGQVPTRPTIVIGIGSGRCGTHSLSALLSAQRNSFVSHERTALGRQCRGMEWPSEDHPVTAEEENHRVRNQVEFYLNRKEGNFDLVGDVGHFHLAYAESYLHLDQRIKFVVLKRPRQDTIESWLRWWSTHKQNNRFPFLPRAQYAKTEFKYRIWDKCFPNYNFPNLPALQQREGLERCVPSCALAPAIAVR